MNLNLTLLRNTVPATDADYIVVRHFGFREQRVLGTVKQGFYWPNDIAMEDGELAQIASFMMHIKSVHERDLRIVHFHDLYHGTTH